MSDSLITVQGYVGTKPTLRAAGQHVVASFRMASTPRRLVRSTGAWTDGETQWYTVSCWRALGENVSISLDKGDPVFVQGRLTSRTWAGRDGVESTTFEIEALTVGHDLNRVCTGTVRRPASAPRREAEPASTTTWPEPEPRPGDEGDGVGDEEAMRQARADWAIPGAPAPDPWAEPSAPGAPEESATAGAAETRETARSGAAA
jgi:single-strand DNA-binding protein